jgi:hypothetical protein
MDVAGSAATGQTSLLVTGLQGSLDRLARLAVVALSLPHASAVVVGNRPLPELGASRGTAGPQSPQQSLCRYVLGSGDVCGNGVMAAKSAALARYTLRAGARRQTRPSLILVGLNQALLDWITDDPRSLTAIYATVRPTPAGVSATVPHRADATETVIM